MANVRFPPKASVPFRPIADTNPSWQVLLVSKRGERFLKDGFVQAALIIIIFSVTPLLGRALDGDTTVFGRFMATYYLVVAAICTVLFFIGVRRVRGRSHDD